MINTALPHILRFFAFILLQVLILDNLTIHQLINPYIYPLFLFLLPFDTPKWLVIMLGFTLGLCIDILSIEVGIHAAATTFIAYLRPYVINMLTPTGGYEIEDSPSIGSLGFNWFLPYVSILTLIHHLVLFLIELLTINPIWFVSSKILLSTLVSLTLMIIVEFLFYSKKKA